MFMKALMTGHRAELIEYGAKGRRNRYYCLISSPVNPILFLIRWVAEHMLHVWGCVPAGV
jgi:hypothetical protein